MTRLHRIVLAAVIGLILLSGSVGPAVHAQDSGTPDAAALAQVNEQFSTALITSVTTLKDETVDGTHRIDQTLHLRIVSGPDAGKEFDEDNGVLDNRDDTVFAVGETVVVDRQTDVAGKVTYTLHEKYRLPAIVWLTIIFVVLSVAIITWFVLPRIVAGSDPFGTCLIGCVCIACTSLYLAHGFNKRTSIAFLSTIVTLAIAAVIDLAFVHYAKLFGMGSEESLYLQTGPLQNLDLRGLLLGGILIGCLGVLDDVTTAQTAAIDEISKANPSLSAAELRSAGASVGKEHIASLINTLALAYVGTSLPLLLLVKTQGDYPLWITVNGEFFAEEIVRTLVGSATLLVAVPVATWFAAYFLQGGRGGGGHGGHSHAHGHAHVHGQQHPRPPLRPGSGGISVS